MAKKLVAVWRGWCSRCGSYLCYWGQPRDAVEWLVCPTCRARAPAVRGTAVGLAGDLAAAAVLRDPPARR